MCDLWASRNVFNFRTWLRPECRVKSCFRFPLIGCCYCRWLISLTSAVNWNIILIVFLCSIKYNVQHAWPECQTHSVCACAHRPTKNQCISIKKRKLVSQSAREEKSWSEKRPHTMQKTHMNSFKCSILHVQTTMFNVRTNMNDWFRRSFQSTKHYLCNSFVHYYPSSASILPSVLRSWWTFFLFSFWCHSKWKINTAPFMWGGKEHLKIVSVLFLLIEKFIVEINERVRLQLLISEFDRVAPSTMLQWFMHNIVFKHSITQLQCNVSTSSVLIYSEQSDGADFWARKNTHYNFYWVYEWRLMVTVLTDTVW